MQQNDTIAALATPPGSAALALLRISGAYSICIAETIFCPYSGKPLRDLPGFSGLLGEVRDGEETIDEAIAYVYRAPKSYTGEDCVEISCHGGEFTTAEILRLLTKHGARPAEPGEFTRRAFLNGKLGLTQAEAVCDLINAGSADARRAALAAKDGALSTAVASLVETLTAAGAHLAAWSDYPEEDLIPVDAQDLQQQLTGCASRIEDLLDTYARGQLVRSGVRTAIVGKPNVGKSTLMNLLSRTRRSIVTAVPGTTRDIVRESVRLGPHILHLLDTAGIRGTDDPVEREGVRLAAEQIESAQLILAVFDCATPFDAEDAAVLRLLANRPNCIAVINKSDLPPALDLDEIRTAVPHLVTISAKEGQGTAELESRITERLQLEQFDPAAALVANERQRHCLGQARTALLETIDVLASGMTLDAVSVLLEDALAALLTLTGERVTDKVVDEVFAQFCVGK